MALSLRALPGRLAACMLALALLSVPARDADAAFHLWEISEVYTNANGNIQYFELTTTFNSQHVLADHVFQASSDGVVETFTFPANLGSSSTANKTFIIGSPGFEEASGITPDYVLDCGGPFFNPAANSITITLVGADSVTFATSSLPGSANQSLNFDTAGTTPTVATATPKNFGGSAGSMDAACLAQGNCPNGCNTPPQITAGPQVSICQGGSASVTIAEVEDLEDPAGSLLVEATSGITGLTVTDVVNVNGVVTATLTASASATVGAGNVSMEVTDGGGLTDTTNLPVTVTANAPPSLGTYPDSSVVAGSSKNVTPSAAPADDSAVESVFVGISPDFGGSVSVAPATGVVTISNAGGSSSVYTVTVTATDDCGVETAETFQLTLQVLAAPANFVATLTAPATASLTWSPSDGATYYTVYRRTTGTDWEALSSPATTNLSDSTLAADHAYLYRVQAANAGGAASLFTPPDFVTTFGYTDNPIAAGVTPVKAQHVLELREAVDALHSAMGMTPPVWTPAALAGVAVQADHFTALRTAIDAYRTSLALGAFGFSGSLVAGTTVISESHMAELRRAAKGHCPTANCL